VQARIIHKIAANQGAAERRQSLGGTQGSHARGVSGLGIEAEEKSPEERVGSHYRRRAGDGLDCTPWQCGI
jgi:hypothetical protein